MVVVESKLEVEVEGSRLVEEVAVVVEEAMVVAVVVEEEASKLVGKVKAVEEVASKLVVVEVVK